MVLMTVVMGLQYINALISKLSYLCWLLYIFEEPYPVGDGVLWSKTRLSQSSGESRLQ
jgi:hypothetical protein